MTKEEAVIKLKSSLREEGWYPVDHTIKLDVCEHPKAGIWSFCLAVVDGVEIEPCERYVAWDVEEDAPVYWGSIPQFDKYALENFEERGRIEIGGQANMNLQTALIILKENAGDLAGERLLYSQCPEGFEFWADRPAGYCGACFYKIRENGEFFFWPSPGFGKGHSCEGWTEPKRIDVDFSADPPTWREI